MRFVICDNTMNTTVFLHDELSFFNVCSPDKQLKSQIFCSQLKVSNQFVAHWVWN